MTSYTSGNALLRKDGETPLFDGLGSERTVTNSSGSGTGSLTLSAFGGTVASSGSSTSAYKFGATSGYRDDGDAGLVKVGCRYYDPEVGRFTTRDTDLSQKAYVYCNGDPVNAVDPSGHWVLNFGGSGSISLGPVHFSYSVGIALQFPGLGATGFGGEIYNTGGFNAGWGLGATVSPVLGVGQGSLAGFNGSSTTGTLLLGDYPGFTVTTNSGYTGLEIGHFALGYELGLYPYGMSYTIPLRSF